MFRNFGKMIGSLYCLALSPKSRENFRTLLKLVNTYMIETRIFESSVYFFFKLRLTNIFVRNFCKSNSNTDLFVRTNSNAAVNFFVDLLNSRSFLFIWIFKSLRFQSVLLISNNNGKMQYISGEIRFAKSKLYIIEKNCWRYGTR